jgi:hypothetical protein
MQKNKKTGTQDTSKAETTTNEIKPATKKVTKKADPAVTDVTAQKQDKKTTEAKADDATIKSETKSKTSTPAPKKSTSKTPPKAKVNAADQKAIIASVDADAEKQTGRPTGAIYGSGGDIIAVQNPAGASQAAQEAVSATKVYGIIQASGNTISLSQGSIPEGQLKLTGPSKAKGFQKQASGYNDQFVTILGEFQGEGSASTFLVRSIASHSDIARRAYELSESGGNSSEDNWIRAENELLGQG